MTLLHLKEVQICGAKVLSRKQERERERERERKRERENVLIVVDIVKIKREVSKTMTFSCSHENGIVLADSLMRKQRL